MLNYLFKTTFEPTWVRFLVEEGWRKHTYNFQSAIAISLFCDINRELFYYLKFKIAVYWQVWLGYVEFIAVAPGYLYETINSCFFYRHLRLKI